MEAIASLFKPRAREKAEEVVIRLKNDLLEMTAGDTTEEQAAGLVEDVRKRVAQLKVFIFGEPGAGGGAGGAGRASSSGGDHHRSASFSHSASFSGAVGDRERIAIEEEEAAQHNVEMLSEAVQAVDLFPLLLAQLKSVDFETRKGVECVFKHLLRNDISGFTSYYMRGSKSLLNQLVDGYESPDVALCCGSMLRECIKFHCPHAAEGGDSVPSTPAVGLSIDSSGGGGSTGGSAAAAAAAAAAAGTGDEWFLHEALLLGPDGGVSDPLRKLFEEHVHNPNFEVSADAFETLTTLLTSNKAGVFRNFDPEGDQATRMRYDELFGMYNRMLQSDNYVLKRQSLKLLSEFLLDRDNFSIMMRYISERPNLKIIMGMLRHKQPNIQFEAFHVFKVFVANPEKPADIVDILACNKGKLVAFLQGFQNDKDDSQFAEEKAMLIETLKALPDVAVPGTPAPAAAVPAPAAAVTVLVPAPVQAPASAASTPASAADTAEHPAPAGAPH